MKVLVVDDDPGFCDLVAFTLAREGITVLQAHKGDTALRLWREQAPDLILLDINLLQMDGFSVLRRLRVEGDTPVIMLTASQSEEDMVQALSLGADAYVEKPLHSRTFVARVKAVMRRAGMVVPSTQQEYIFEDLRFDSNTRHVQFADGTSAQLTRLEARLLEHLLVNRPRVVPYESLISHVWGPQGGDQAMLRQLIRRLRKKVEPDPGEATLVINLPGRGYGMVAPD